MKEKIVTKIVKK